MSINLKKVTVKFIYEGESHPTDITAGALFPETGKVLVDTDSVSLYDCVPSEAEPGVYVVDLDENGRNYLDGKGPTALIDLITQ